MKLTNIEVRNVLGISSADVALTTPVTLFCGPNGNGKTSLSEAVRMALGGDLIARGVKLKKDYKTLVHEGAKSGTAEVRHEGGMVTFVVFPKGETTNEDVYRPKPMLPFVMEPQRFAALDDKERRSVLFKLMGLSAKPADVIARLIKRGVGKTKAERVGPLLIAGFDAASKEAAEKATQAKGMWRQVTGETYGSEKAQGWQAAAPAFDATASQKLTDELRALEEKIGAAQRDAGGLQVTAKRRAELRVGLPALLEKIDGYARIAGRLELDSAGLKEWEEKLLATTVAAGSGKREGLIHDLASAVDFLLSFVNTEGGATPEEQEALAALQTYEQQYGKVGAGGDPEAQARLPEVKRSRDLMANAVANVQRQLDEIKAAQTQAESITEELEQPFDEEARTKANEEITGLQARRSAATQKLDTLNAQKVAADAAEKKTKDAAEHHADVIAWDACAKALAPDGIPGEMLAEAMGPFNARLVQSAGESEWLTIQVDQDMVIRTADGRPYQLLSESEKWRADAMLAEAISHLSGLKFLMLDRYDVLDAKGRADALAWLTILADAGELETCLVFATLRAIPADLDPLITAHWIQSGVVEALAEAA